MSEITSLSQLDLQGYYTYQDYLSWKFKERVELIKGTIFKMSPAPNVKHQIISRLLLRQLDHGLIKSSCHLFHAPFDVRLPVSFTPGKEDTVVQPDIVVICDVSKLDKQGCNGAPEIVIEILSPGNSHREMKEKFELYEASLVSEYWIVDPEHQDIVVYKLNEQEKYYGSKPYVSGEVFQSEILPKISIDISEVFK
ncbi:MAG: Uma2 family endonuclease [Saprospiraceae bacterium]|jgi:Uma2 family endonuclease